MKSKILAACKAVKLIRQLVPSQNHRFFKLLVNTSFRFYPKTVTESSTLFFRHVIQDVADIIFIKVFSVIHRIQNFTCVKLRLLQFLISPRFNLSDENFVSPVHWRTRITVMKKLILAAFNFHCQTAVSSCYSGVGDLAHFVEIDSHILVSKNAVYLFLVTKSANPNLASVPQGNQTIVYVCLIIFCTNSFVQPRNQSFVKNRTPRILRPKATNQMAATRVPAGTKDNRHYKNSSFTRTRTAKKQNVFCSRT